MSDPAQKALEFANTAEVGFARSNGSAQLPIIIKGWTYLPAINEYVAGNEIYIYKRPGRYAWDKRVRCKVTIEIETPNR